MSPRPLRVGLIGAGAIAAAHARLLDEARGVELVAVCDVDLARAEALAAPRGAHASTGWEDVLEAAADAVLVCTPPLHHRAPAVAALAAGVAVYLEKPIARDLDDARAIVATAAASGAVCAVGYQWHATGLLEAAQAALAGDRVALLVGRNIGPTLGRPWFVDVEEGGGQILERCSHHIDLQRALAGEVVAVQALAGENALAQAGAARGAGAIDDAIVLVLRFAGGAVGTIHSAWTRDGQPGVFGLDVAAIDATLSLELGPTRHRLTGRAGGAVLDVVDGDPLARSHERFLAAVRAGDPAAVPCTAADAAATLAVARACEAALLVEGPVQVGA